MRWAPEQVLRFPQITVHMWFRVVELLEARGLLRVGPRRLAGFLSCKRLDHATGRVLGPWGTTVIEGGEELAEHYARDNGLGTDQYWADWKALQSIGLARRAVAPAPGRKAAYELCLFARAIPNGLPADLERQLRVWDLPEAEDTHEDSRAGHLTDQEPPVMAPVDAETARDIQDRYRRADEADRAALRLGPRWEHPADSRAAQVAEEIRAQALRLDEDARPSLHTWAVAGALPQAELSELMARNARRATGPKASPLTREGFVPSGLPYRTGSQGAWAGDEMQGQKQKRTPSAATGKSTLPAGGDVHGPTAMGLLRSSWAVWRRKYGHAKVILPSDSGWADLERVVAVALRRATPGEVRELLTANLPDEVRSVGAFVAARLWRLVSSRRDTFAHRRAAFEEDPAPVPSAAAMRAGQLLAQRQAQAGWNSVYARWGLTIGSTDGASAAPRAAAPQSAPAAPATGSPTKPQAAGLAIIERARRAAAARESGQQQ